MEVVTLSKKTVILFLLVFCGVFLHADNVLLNYLPSEKELKGWSIYKGSLKILKGEQLSEIYNGGYGLYTDFGVDLVVNQIYERKDSDILNVVIHQCFTATDSFSLFTYWKSLMWDDKLCRFESVKNEAFICENDTEIFSGYVWKGKYFVSLGLSSSEEWGNSENDLILAMELISDKIEDVNAPLVVTESFSKDLFDLKNSVYSFRESSLKRILEDEFFKNIAISGFLYSVKLPLLSYKNSWVDILYFENKESCESFLKTFVECLEEGKYKKFDKIFSNTIYIKEEIYQYKFSISYSSAENDEKDEEKSPEKKYLYYYSKGNNIVVVNVVCKPSEIKQIISRIYESLIL